MTHGTVNIQFTEKLEGKDVSRVYGILIGSIGSTTFSADRFGLKTIRTVQLTPQSVQRTWHGGTVDFPYVVASIDTQGSIGNSFKLMGTPMGIRTGSPVAVHPSRIHFKVVGE